MKEVKCECGHVNPHGTVLCESCGVPLIAEKTEGKLLDMRYEGSARRSQTYNKTIIDKIWNFFSSVKVGVWLIVITLVASAIGTIFPQQMYIPQTVPPIVYYEEQYGFLGKMYYQLGFHDLYSSWWYLLLMASIGVSLVICSIDRVVPLYRALKKQRVTRHNSFLQKQRVFGVTKVEATPPSFDQIKEKLKAKRYHIREENGNILAEKGRFSRWGPYVNHCGLIIFLLGGMLRFVPGMYIDDMLWIREGETKLIPETKGEFYLENKDFILDIYDAEKDNEAFSDALENAGGMIPKNFQSDVVLYKKSENSVPGEEAELEKVKEYSIRVNDPIKFEGFALYQMEYKLDELSSMAFTLVNKMSEEQFGTIQVDLIEPESYYDLGNGYGVEVMSYFPDFEFNDEGQPTTKSRIPNNPAFIFNMITPDKPEGEISFVAIQQTVEPLGDNDYQLKFSGLETVDVSGLTVRKDLTLWIFALGGFIFMVGVAQGSYWNHRRIWIKRNDDEIWVAAHTNKNWHGLKNEIHMILEDSGIQDPEDQSTEKEVG